LVEKFLSNLASPFKLSHLAGFFSINFLWYSLALKDAPCQSSGGQFMGALGLCEAKA